MRQQLKKGLGGPLTIELRHPPDEGSVTVTITRASGSALAAPVADAAVADPFRFESDGDVAITGTEGLDYVVYESNDLLPIGTVVTLTNGAGQSQELQVRDCRTVDDDIELYFRSPLEFDVSSGSVVGHTVSYTVVAGNCPAIEQYFHATIKYTAGGTAHEEELTYDVGLGKSYNPASYSDFSAKWATISSDNVQPWTRTGLDSALRSGYDSVESVYAVAGRNVNRIRNRSALVPQIINRTMYWMAVAGIVPSYWTDKVEEWIDFLDKQYDELYKTANIAWYDDDDDGVASEEELAASRVVSIRFRK